MIDVSVRALSGPVYTQTQIDSALEHVFGVDTQLLTDQTYYVITSDDQLVAAGGWSARATLYGGDQTKGASDPMLDPARDAARIRAFFVRPEWTRQGLARRIYAACETAARQRGFRRFELVATLPGVPLYTALGFAAREAVEVPLPVGPLGLTLPCIRMERAISSTSQSAGLSRVPPVRRRSR
ncbi:MAG: GNAT family N-acetyltransferase [Vicinamibacterales bacterium]